MNWLMALSSLRPSRSSLLQASTIGALSSVRLGRLTWETKQYEPSVSLNEQLELLSLIGDVATNEGERLAHSVVGKRDGTAPGGHLLQAHIRPTCEVVLTESPVYLRKEYDASAGIPLISV